MQDATLTFMEPLIGSQAPGIVAAVRTWIGVAVAAMLPVCAQASDGRSKQTPSTSMAETVVQVYPATVVQGDSVLLSDVARLSGESAQLAAAWKVASAPSCGLSCTVDVAAVQKALGERGVNLANWIFRGASRCKVSKPTIKQNRKTSTRSHSSNHQAISADNLSSLPKTTTSAASDDVSVDPRTLEAHLRKHIADRVAELGGKPVIQFGAALNAALTLSEPAYQFAIKDRDKRRLGLIGLEVTVSEKGRINQVLPILVRVALRKQVVMAARAINRNQIIESADLTLTERVYERPDQIGLSDTAPIVGQRAMRFIEPFTPINIRDLEPVPLIKRNDLVTVWVRNGDVAIKATAKAMSEASYGQPVTLKNEMSREPFIAQATGPRTAEVMMAKATPTDTASSAGEMH